MSSVTSSTKSRSAVIQLTKETVQRYGNIMEEVLREQFPVLYGAPDSLYVMMATMGLESSFKINPVNHSSISNIVGIGRSYWFDPVIVPKKSDPSPTVQAALLEGLSAKALMATMGMYQVRNTRESNAALSITGVYQIIAEDNSLMVNPGQSISAVFTNDDAGARKSMIMGSIIMEGKYINRLKQYSSSSAIQAAIGDYLGRVGSKDILGSSPTKRIALINDPSTGIAKVLRSAGFTKANSGKVFVAKSVAPAADVETKTNVAATTSATPIQQNGC